MVTMTHPAWLQFDIRKVHLYILDVLLLKNYLNTYYL